MLKEILKYQAKDGELLKIERSISESNAKKVVNQMVTIVKKAQQNLKDLEKNSESLIKEFEDLNKTAQNQADFVEKLLKQKLDTKTEADLKEIEKQIKETTTSLLLIQKNSKKLAKSIETSLKEFEQSKNEVMVAKQKHKQGMDAYNKLLEASDEKIKKLNAELKALEPKIEPKLLEKYKTMRQDKKFPIFVPLLNNSCGGCSMELAMSKKHILEEKGVLECENCHRIIYKNE